MHKPEPAEENKMHKTLEDFEIQINHQTPTGRLDQE